MPVASIELDFPNCYATLDATNTNVKTMTVAWKAYPGAASYKVFFSSKSEIVYSPITANPTQLLAAVPSQNGTLISEQTNAILGTSTTYTFTNSRPKQLAYVYAYSDSSATIRLSNFPSTVISANNIQNLVYYDYTEYSPLDAYGLSIEQAAMDAAFAAIIAATAAGEDPVAARDASWAQSVANAATQGVILNPSPRNTVNTKYVDTTITSQTGFTRNISTKAFSTAPPTAPVCFLASAPVLTPSGYRRIDSLKVGDLVSTPQGTAPIKSIHKKLYEASSSTNPYLIPKGLFGATEDLEISPRHKIAFKGNMIEARNLGLKKVKHTGSLTYYNLEVNNENMIVAGVEVESLKPLVRVTITQEAFKQLLHTQYGGKMTEEIKSKCQLLADGRVSVPSIKH